jgi:hypothetical protein
MPCDYSKYPANWFTEIRPRILAREGNKCKFCGVPNYALIKRNPEDRERYAIWVDERKCFSYQGRLYGEAFLPWSEMKTVRVILTIAHLDQDIANNDDTNLAALCQRCHLQHDIQHHTANRKYNKNPLIFPLPKPINA